MQNEEKDSDTNVNEEKQSWNDEQLCYDVPSIKSFIIFFKKYTLVSNPLPCGQSKLRRGKAQVSDIKKKKTKTV